MKSIKGELFQERWVEIDPLSAEVGGSWQGRSAEGASASWEPLLVRFVYDRLREKENPVLLDVGANTGTMSLLGAFLPNLFSYAFEPVLPTLELIQRNILLNGLVKRANLSQVTRASSPPSSRPAAITFLTVPRGFEGDVGMRQHNAIGSWLALTPRPEVILFGDDPGVAEVADELGVEHIPWIEKTSLGTPLFSDVLLKGQENAAGSVVVYVNTDIILFDDFTRAIAKVQEKRWSRYLLIGQRQNWDLKHPINFSDPQWRNKIKDKAKDEGVLASTGAKDYFVFPKGMYEKVPPFAVGRAAFDNWMVAAAVMRGVPVADLTDDVLAVHQNHDYQHIVGDSSAVTMTDRLPEAVEAHPEVKRNRALYDADAWFFHRTDFATWQMQKGVLKRRFPLSGTLWELFFYAFKAVGSFIKQLFKYRKIINYNYWNLYLYRAAMVKERYYTFTRNKYFQAVYYFLKKRF
ncbi:MAG: hypothetical protein LBD04_00475 [Synergistaceae bacterium]|jgi:hypothetical protein|nr:hypothetical protein [Synergistaceae bacterium]